MAKEPIDLPANDASLTIQPARPSAPTDPNIGHTVADPLSRGDESSKKELTGRATGTGEDLQSLFANDSDEHLRDGFRSGNGDDPESDVERTDEFPQIDR